MPRAFLMGALLAHVLWRSGSLWSSLMASLTCSLVTFLPQFGLALLTRAMKGG